MALSSPIRVSRLQGQRDKPGQLNAWVERASGGHQVNCHANGDVAIDMHHGVERAQRCSRPTRVPRSRTTLITDDPSAGSAAVGAGALYLLCLLQLDKFVFYGEELMKRCMAFRSLLDAGVPAMAGSDFSPGPFAPLMGMQGMVTRTGWDGKTWGANQRVTVDQAIQINTLNGAFGSREETIKGSIDLGSWPISLSWPTIPHGRSREDQGHSDRPHGSWRRDEIPGLSACSTWPCSRGGSALQPMRPGPARCALRASDRRAW
jgi:hypothetical protein